MMSWCQLGFQDSSSPIMEEFVFFHDFIMVWLSSIILLVGVIMLRSWAWKSYDTTIYEHQMLEMIWTLLPAVVLVQIALPSLSLLYLFEESYETGITIKVLGHQWYWSYEYWDFSEDLSSVCFDSYMLPVSDVNQFRLLDVDCRLILPYLTHIRVLVSSVDVLHSWTLPSMGVKADATPGRLNQLTFLSNRTGVFYGQCSEICGANHSFMPIVMEAVNLEDFIKWSKLVCE